MEEIVIPDISSVLQTSKEYIDRPATIAEVLKSRCRPDNISSSTTLLDDVLAKLTRHENPANCSPATSDLSNIVKELALTILSQNNMNKPASTPVMFRFFKTPRFLRTIDTIGDDLRNELEEKTRELNKHIKRHQDLTLEIQKAQKQCLMSNSKVSKYRLMLTTAETSKQHPDGQPTKRETKLSHEIREEIQFELMDRLESSLCDLNDFTNTVLETNSRTVIQRKIMEIDVRKLVDTVTSQGQKVYTYPSPTEYTKMHGYAEKIPARQLSENGAYGRELSTGQNAAEQKERPQQSVNDEIH